MLQTSQSPAPTQNETQQRFSELHILLKHLRECKNGLYGHINTWYKDDESSQIEITDSIDKAAAALLKVINRCMEDAMDIEFDTTETAQPWQR